MNKRKRRELLKLHRQGLSDLEIASQLGIDTNDVVSFRKENGLFSKDEINNRKRTRKWIARGVSASILTTIFGGGMYFASSLPAFQQFIHRKAIAERQTVLDKFVADERAPYVGGVLYNYGQFTHSSGHSYGITLSDASLFGMHKPSYLVFFRDAFEDETRDIMGKILFVPSNVKIKTAFKHESIHAKYNFEGIKLGNGLSLDATNYSSTRGDLKAFIDEAMTHMETYEFFRDQNQDKSAILFTAGKMGGWFDLNYPKLIAAGNFSKSDLQLLEPVMVKYNNLVPETNKLWQEYAASK